MLRQLAEEFGLREPTAPPDRPGWMASEHSSQVGRVLPAVTFRRHRGCGGWNPLYLAAGHTLIGQPRNTIRCQTLAEPHSRPTRPPINAAPERQTEENQNKVA